MRLGGIFDIDKKIEDVSIFSTGELAPNPCPETTESGMSKDLSRPSRASISSTLSEVSTRLATSSPMTGIKCVLMTS